MQFSHFAQYLEKLEQTSSRLTMTAQLAELYQKLDRNEIAPATYLMQGKLVPAYESLEFNLSIKMIERALAQLLSHGSAANNHHAADQLAAQTNLFGEEDTTHLLSIVTKHFKKMGDIGSVAQQIVKEMGLRSSSLSLAAVFAELNQIARYSGTGSQEKKLINLAQLLGQSDPLSARYIVRIIMGKLRLGFSTMTLLDALSWATTGNKSDRDTLEEAFNKQADVGRLATVYLTATSTAARAKALAAYTVHIGVPIIPALCQRLNSTTEIIEKMGEVFVEPKFDGLRVQIHYQRGQQTRALTRNLEDISAMLPELTQLDSLLDCDSCILDGEAIGYNPKTNQLVPFQLTITRKRKYGVSEHALEVPLRTYVFDLLELDGTALIDQPLNQRKKLLAKLFEPTIAFAQTAYIRSTDPDQITQFHHQQLALGLEGAVIKQVDSVYRGGRKGWRWVKIKEAEGTQGKLSDTLDCVVMGYYVGRGKRSQFGLGAFLVGVLDEKNDQIVTLSKIGTGLTDEQLAEMKQRCDQLKVPNQPSQYQVHKDLFPDVWVEPGLVVEIAADELTKSPKHSAGVALRFPRLLGFRDDKTWQEATTLKETTQISHLSANS